MIERTSVAFEVKAFDGETGAFAGHGAAWNSLDGKGQIMAPGAFAESLQAFLERGFIGGVNHNYDEPVGKPTAAREDATGVYVEGIISDTQRGRDLRTLMRDGVIRFLSIGFERVSYSKLMTGEAVRAYWSRVGYSPTEEDVRRLKRWVKDDEGEEFWVPGVTLVEKAKLHEVSPTPIPANYGAQIISVKGGLPDGLPFSEHSEAVLAAVEEVTARAREIRELRARDGRELGGERKAMLRDLAARVGAWQEALAGLAADPEPPKEESKADPALVAGLVAQFEAIRARRLGVL